MVAACKSDYCLFVADEGEYDVALFPDRQFEVSIDVCRYGVGCTFDSYGYMGSWSPLSKTFPSITPCLTAISVWAAPFPFTFCACIEARDGGVRQQPSKIQRQALGVN